MKLLYTHKELKRQPAYGRLNKRFRIITFSQPRRRVHALQFVAKNEGYLLDVIERLHEDCYWRKRCGSCKTCDGTPVANT